MMGSRDSKSSSFIEVGLSVWTLGVGLRNFSVRESVNKTMVILTWRLNCFGDAAICGYYSYNLLFVDYRSLCYNLWW
jgi:hypothetical protein